MMFRVLRLVLVLLGACIVAGLALIALFGGHTPVPVPYVSELDVPVTCYAQDYGDRPWPARLEADGTWRCHREDAPPDVPRRQPIPR